jgi:hypothetical protein
VTDKTDGVVPVDADTDSHGAPLTVAVNGTLDGLLDTVNVCEAGAPFTDAFTKSVNGLKERVFCAHAAGGEPIKNNSARMGSELRTGLKGRRAGSGTE